MSGQFEVEPPGNGLPDEFFVKLFIILINFTHLSGKRLYITGTDEITAFRSDDVFRPSADGTDGRHSGGHGFYEDNPEGFCMGGQHKGVTACQQQGDFFSGEASCQGDLLFQPEGAYLVLQIGLLFPVSGNDKRYVRTVVKTLRKGVQQFPESFSLAQVAYADEGEFLFFLRTVAALAESADIDKVRYYDRFIGMFEIGSQILFQQRAYADNLLCIL